MERLECCDLRGKATLTLYYQFNRNTGSVATSHCSYYTKMEIKPLPILSSDFAAIMITNSTKPRYLALSSNLSSIPI